MEEMERYHSCHELKNAERFMEAQRRHPKALFQEETFWKQRAKMHWISEGDLNTKFFYMSVTTRRKIKKIKKPIIEDQIEVNYFSQSVF